MARQFSFNRFAAIAAIISLPLAAGNLWMMLVAAGFDANAMSNPSLLLSRGASAANWWYWSMILDVLGYYLFIVPLLFALWTFLRPKTHTWYIFALCCIGAYCLIGAIGGAVLAAATPPLIKAYPFADSLHRAAQEVVFNGFTDAVYRGMWNFLEELLAGVGWLILGLILRSRYRVFGIATIILGLACLLDSLSSMAGNDTIASFGLFVYLFLAPAWACWLGVIMLRAPDQANRTT